jgi:hypothetical protein
MKAGYVALLGAFVAFSAYEGAPRQAPSPQERQLNFLHEPGSAPQTALTNPSVENFPTVAGGMCKLTVNPGGTGPCDTCKAICPADDLSHLISDYFSYGRQDDPTYLSTHWRVPQRDQNKIRFVIATLPDPVHTHMALLFDRGIEAIQSAAQASGFLFARAWMPWDISVHNESADFTVRLAQEKYRASVETLPGLMIFQKLDKDTATASEILFVLVVGETPTAGLHIEQFQNALAIRRSIVAGLSKDEPPSAEIGTLRIYGPEFSGSLRSLYNVLSDQPDFHSLNIFVRSGSVSSTGAIEDFQKATRTACVDRLDFKTFQFTDIEQEYYLSLFLSDREHLHSHVAILSEDETAFGNQEPQSKSLSGAPISGTPSPASGGPGCKPSLPNAHPPDPSFTYLRLYFPRGIAQLRDAYQANVKVQTNTDRLKNSPQEALPLNLSITGNDEDTVSPYSPLQTPLSEESVLQGVVSALRRQHARVVVIRAADPLDMIFLSRYLRQNYPQARLITIGADLLMVHEFYDPRFHGILALSPYPLMAGISFRAPIADGQPPLPQAEVEAKEVERVFPDSYSVGAFNAMMALLALPANASPTAPILPPADYLQFGLPSFLLSAGSDSDAWQPRLWLLTIGNDGYWPADTLDRDKNQKHAKNPPYVPWIPKSGARSLSHPLFFVHFSVGWTLFWLFVFGLTCAFALLLAHPAPFQQSEILGRFQISDSPVRSRLLFAGGMLLLAAQTIFIIPSIFWLGRFRHVGYWSGIVPWVSDVLDSMWLPVLGYVLSVALLGAACYLGFSKRESPRLARWGAGIAAAALLIVTASTAICWSRDLGTEVGSFIYRFIHVESGVSPALPVLLLLCAWIWWFWQSFTGVASFEEQNVILPPSDQFAVVEDAYDRVRLAAVGGTSKKWPWDSMMPVPCDARILGVAIVGIVAILLLMRPSEIAEAFELRAYKVVYWILLYSCLFLVCYLVAQIMSLWLEFRAMLRAIHQLPFRRGFQDLRKLTWKPLWKLAGTGREEFVQRLGEEFDALGQIVKIAKKGTPLATAVERASDSITTVSTIYEPATKADHNRTFDLRVWCSWANRNYRGVTMKRIVEGGKIWYGTHVARAISSKEIREFFNEVQVSLANLAAQALIQANSSWKAEEAVSAKGDADCAKAETAAKKPVPETKTPSPDTRKLERFLCLFYLNVILVPLRRLQTLILALAGVFVFVLMSYSSYPFESRESFHGLLISIFFAISLGVGVVYGQMYSNSMLSLITNTEPGELGLDFWVKLGSFVFIPLLSILSVQFPGLNDFLFSWLQPALESVK